MVFESDKVERQLHVLDESHSVLFLKFLTRLFKAFDWSRDFKWWLDGIKELPEQV